MKLNRLTDRVFYLDGNPNIGVIKCLDHKSVVLVDTGIDEDVGRRALNILAENGLVLKAVINTHSHADHCGANSFVQKRTGAPIFASHIEAQIIEQPILEPLYLFSGAAPPLELQNKFLMAAPSEVIKIKKGETRIMIEGNELEIIELPGHTLNQIGVAADGVLFCADSIYSSQTLLKYKIPLFSDWSKAKETLSFLATAQYKWFVPSHDMPSENISALATENIETLNNIEQMMLQVISHKKTSPQVLKEMCNFVGIEVKNMTQYHLLAVSIQACLGCLMQKGKAKWALEDGSLVWETTS